MEESKLTVDERAVLERLVDPDQQAQAKYLWDEDFQRILLGMLLSDRFFLCQSLGLVKPTYFSSEIHQLACRVLIQYFEKYKTLPSKVFVKQEISDRLRERYQNDNETYQAVKLLYLGEVTTLYEYYSKGGVGDMMPGLDSSEAILDKITAFAKTQAMKMAFHNCLDMIRKKPESDETWEKVNSTLKEALMVERQQDMGLDYFQTIDERYDRLAHIQETADVFTSGFDTIDRGLQGGGLFRGELAAWMGLPGTGKSLALVVASVKNIAKGRKILYLSTEMDADRIATRFDTQFSLIGQHELIARREEVKRALLDEVRDYDDKRRLVIKQFPSGTADVNTIRAFHSQCVMNGFRPDIVIVDYPGDMKHFTHIPLHQSYQRILTDLRGFGAEEGHLTLIAIQPNKEATGLGQEEFMDESKQAESFGQNRVLDAFWTLNQTSMEQKAAIGRVFIAKARNGKSRFSFRIRYGFQTQTLTIEEISNDQYIMALNRVRESNADTTETLIDCIPAVGNIRTFQPSDGERVQ
jgi:hypothetical protein